MEFQFLLVSVKSNSQTFTHSTLLPSLPDHVKRKRTFVLSSSSLLLYMCREKKKIIFLYLLFLRVIAYLSFSLCPWFSHSPPRLYCFLFNLLLYGNSSLFLHPFPHSNFFFLFLKINVLFFTGCHCTCLCVHV